jgi:hypothetical protein
LPELSGETGTAETDIESIEEKTKPTQKSGMHYVCGLVALASLLVCLVMAIWVAASTADVYTERLDFAKTALKYVTVIYFVFGVTWIFVREKVRAP